MDKFFPIETPYSSEEYKILKEVVNQGIDSRLEGFTKSKFGKSTAFANKFKWDFHYDELPILSRRLQELYEKTENEDYYNFKTEIEEAVARTKAEEAESANVNSIEEEENFYTEPTAPIQEAPVQQMSSDPVSRFMAMIDGNNMQETMSDSLTNQNGTNGKPQNMVDESTDKEKYEDVVFLQGEEANEPLAILKSKGPKAALKYLIQWHNPGEHLGTNELSNGSGDNTFEEGGYTMSWNPSLNYIGLQYDTTHDSVEMSEDAIAFRKLAGQREKTAPLGRHSPHSQNKK